MKPFHLSRTKWVVPALAFALTAGFFVDLPSHAMAEPTQEQVLVDQATITLNNFLKDPNMGWIRNNLKYAKAVFIVPTLVKAGFFWGGSGGDGVVLARDSKTNTWSQPGFYAVGSVSFGLQFGGEVAEVVMLIMTRRGMEAFYSSNIKLGGAASVAAGPVGIGTEGATSITMSADMLSFVRAKGAYAGVSMDGALIAILGNWNKNYYGQEVRPVDLFVNQSAANSGSLQLRETLRNASK